MSELVFDSQVRSIGELNTENPFYDRVFDVTLPNAASSNDVTNEITTLVKGYTISPTNNFQNNTDGSVSLLGLMSGISETLPNDGTRLNQLTDSVVLIVDILISASSIGNQVQTVYGFSGYGQNLNFRVGGYSAGITLTAQYNYTAISAGGVHNSFIPPDGKRHLAVIHYDHATQTVSGYDNGELIIQGSYSHTSSGTAHTFANSLMPYDSGNVENSKFFTGITLRSKDS